MTTVGLIAEFNPFHKGHEYFIKKAKEVTGADRVIVVMSGNFVQRGEPAMFDKWTRATIALESGADLVLELPILFATANAETFARGAVRVLGECGIVDYLCFGTESGDIELLKDATKILTNETEEFRSLLKSYLDEGMSYPSARGKALEMVSSVQSDIISKPNHILALEYLMALEKYNYPIEPVTIKRQGSGYHDTELTDEMASATAIRQCISANDIETALSQVPEHVRVLYRTAIKKGSAPMSWDNLSDALNYQLRLTSARDIAKIFEVTEGLEHRVVRAIQNVYDVEELIDFIKSKRYTRSKIQRILVHILLNIKTEEVDYFMKKLTLPYIRVLGFKKDSADILGDLTLKSKAPVLSNLKKASEVLDSDGLHLLAVEKISTDIYMLGCPDERCRKPNQDFTTPLSII